MPLWTSSLGFFNRKNVSVRNRVDGLEEIWVFHNSCSSNFKPFRVLTVERVYVMRGRGNNPVEPPAMVLRLFMEGAITWQGYRDAYLDSLRTETSMAWMQKVAQKSVNHNVVLICYEKDPTHCHRRLLAEYMQDQYGVQYLGELQP